MLIDGHPQQANHSASRPTTEMAVREVNRGVGDVLRNLDHLEKVSLTSAY